MNQEIQKLVDDLTAQVARTVAGNESMIVYVQGVPALIQAAVDKVVAAGGATAAELSPLTDLKIALEASTNKMLAAIANPGTVPAS